MAGLFEIMAGLGGQGLKLRNPQQGILGNVGNIAYDQQMFPIDMRRPMLMNPGGSFSTEESFTAQIGDKYYNIPSIWNGRRLTEDEAFKRALVAFRHGAQFPNFKSLDDAIKAAESRSRLIGTLRESDFQRIKK